MTAFKRVLGIDIGMTNTGWSLANMHDSKLKIIACGCIRAGDHNVKYQGTKLVLKGLDIINGIHSTLFPMEEIDAMAVETPGGNTQSAAAAKALGGCAVLIAMLCRRWNARSVLVKPSDVKKCIKFKGKVSKDEVMDYVYAKYDMSHLVKLNSKQEPVKKYFEHIADSVLVLEAALKTSNIFKGLVDEQASTSS